MKFYFHSASVFLILGLLISGSFAVVSAAEKWTISSSLQYSSGNYIYEQNTATVYFYGGLRYHTGKWTLSANVPLISQNSDPITNGGGVFFPSDHHNPDDPGNSRHDNGMIKENGMPEMVAGLGDLYLGTKYRLISNGRWQPDVLANLRIKVPAAGTANNFGSGKFDYGISLTIRKQFRTNVLFADIGYWLLGDPEGITYDDPLVFGIGGGKFFNNANTGILLYYEDYASILDGLDPYRQLSLGLNQKLRTNLTLLFTGAAGITRSAPDFSLSGGMEWVL